MITLRIQKLKPCAGSFINEGEGLLEKFRKGEGKFGFGKPLGGLAPVKDIFLNGFVRECFKDPQAGQIVLANLLSPFAFNGQISGAGVHDPIHLRP